MKCCITTCKTYSEKYRNANNSISLHRFPSDAKLKQKWINVLNEKNFNENPNKRICSLHFDNDDIIQTTKGYKKLRNGAIPCLNLPAKRKSPDEPFDISEFLVLNDSPRKKKLKDEIAQLRIKAKIDGRKIRRLQMNVNRLKKKITSMTALIKDLENKNLLLGEESDILSSMNVNVRTLMKRQISKIKKFPLKRKYSPALRCFALTLNYYSPKAYSYVRKNFDTCLPHPRTLSRWYQSVNGEAGFTSEAFDVLKRKTDLSKQRILCSLMMDEVAIRKHVEWDGNRYHGYVDLGVNDLQNDNAEKATQALVLLIVSLTERWKMPIGFFFIHSMTGEQRASIIKQCLFKCDDVGVDVVSLTMDGCPANITMAKKLGCSLEPENLKTTFRLHPSAKYEIAILLDACHMLKLIRNTFETKKTLTDYQGNQIEWAYLVQLNDLQKKEGLHLANKLKQKHIEYHKQKMKVKLASQLFSNSVADALVVCKENDPAFKNVMPTVTFIRLVNNLFDVLNSRNMRQHEFKKPLFEKNILQTKLFLEYARHYLLFLVACGEEKPLVNTNRKTGFVGFLVCINSALYLYNRLIDKEKKLNYLTMHKFSQDHLELFFGIIRAHGRMNNNPTARQFKAAYKKIIINTELKNSFTGNCLPLEDLAILSCSSSIGQMNSSTERIRILDEDLSNMNVQEEPIPEDLLLEFDEHLNSTLNNILRRQIVTYVSGFVVKYLQAKIKCENCLSALYASAYTNDHYLINTKNKGGLIFPSKDVIHVCIRTECSIRSFKSQHTLNTPKFKTPKITSHTLNSLVGENIFKELNEHMYEQSAFDNHVVLLCKSICEKYTNIRLHHLATLENMRDTKRQQLSKSIIFTGD